VEDCVYWPPSVAENSHPLIYLRADR
jgi:hypothetical protein